MTQINTSIAAKYWKDKGGEVSYLKVIGFVGYSGDMISLLGDEEGNYEILLTAKAARWVAKELNRIAKEMEASQNGRSAR